MTRRELAFAERYDVVCAADCGNIEYFPRKALALVAAQRHKREHRHSVVVYDRMLHGGQVVARMYGETGD